MSQKVNVAESAMLEKKVKVKIKVKVKVKPQPELLGLTPSLPSL